MRSSRGDGKSKKETTAAPWATDWRILRGSKGSLEGRLSKAPPSTVRLHPEQALNDSNISAEATDVLRSLIDRIELRPKGEGQGIATLHGDLAQILALCDDPNRKQKLPRAGASGSQLSVVAGARNRHYLLFRAEGLPIVVPDCHAPAFTA